MRSARAAAAFYLGFSALTAALWWGAAAAPVEDVDAAPDFGMEPRDQDAALVIGIEKYRDVEAPSAYSASDAALVKEYLKALGFRESNVRLMLNERATRTDFIKSVERWLPDNAKPDGKVFVYYSGHGAPDLSDPERPRAFLLPYDGDPNDLENTGYPIERLYDRLGKLKAAQVIVVLDSCFSGAGGRSVLARGARPLVARIEPVGVIAARMAVLTATQPNQISTSSPAQRHGVLTYRFLQALREGRGGLAQIYKRIKPLVEDDAHSLGVTQSPSLALGPGADPVLATDLELAIARQKKAEAERAERARREEEAKRRAEQERLAEEAKRVEAEKERMAAAQAEAERRHREEMRRLQREAAEKAERQRREFEEEKRRLEREGKREAPTFVPPTF